MENVLLRVEDIEKSFNKVNVLKKVNLEIKAGEVHALMGENGAGKSTIIKIITGIYPKDAGKIYYKGKDVEINSRQDAKNLGIAVIYQELSLIPTLSVMQNILLGEEISKLGLLKSKEMKKKVLNIMETYGLKLSPDAIVETLSIAQRQMVEILKALTFEASMIIMDEPTASLSASESESLFSIIQKLKDKGVSIIYVSHRLEEVYRLSDRLTILRDGKNVAILNRGEYNPSEVIRLMIGKDLGNNVDPIMRESDKEIGLEVKNLNQKGVLHDINFCVHKGEVLGIGGLVGSGRTEMLRCIYGIDKYNSGTITFEGKSIGKSVKKNIEMGFALVPEDRRNQGFVPLLSVNKNVALTNYDKLANVAKIVNGKAEMEMTLDVIKRLDVRPNNPNISVGNLSGGNQQKVVLGKWFMRELKVLMIDEPTAGIDVGAKDEIYNLLEVLASKGVVVIVVSSDLQELLKVSHRIIVFRKGRIIKEFKDGKVSQEDILKAASGIEEKEVV